MCSLIFLKWMEVCGFCRQTVCFESQLRQSVLRFCSLQNGNNNSTYPIELLRRLNGEIHVMFLEQCVARQKGSSSISSYYYCHDHC